MTSGTAALRRAWPQITARLRQALHAGGDDILLAAARSTMKDCGSCG